MWVLGSNLHVKVDIKTGRAERLGITDSPYCVLDSKVCYKMPTFNFEGNYMFFNASIDSLLLAVLRLIKLNNINKLEGATSQFGLKLMCNFKKK